MKVVDNPDAYKTPSYLVPVTPQTAELFLTSQIKLGDFSSELKRDKDHFIALRAKLLTFLDMLGNRLENEERGATLGILRGFVSPYTRLQLKQQGVSLVEYSRYQYGDSVTVIADKNQDGMMDDLTGDGEIDIQDAEWLADIIDDLQRKTKTWGGVGIYAHFKDPVASDTPCVHLDLRGWRERWRQAK